MTIDKNVNKISNKNSISRKVAAGLLAVLILCVFSFISSRNTYAEEGEKEAAGTSENGATEVEAFEVTNYDMKAWVSKDHSYKVEEKISNSASPAASAGGASSDDGRDEYFEDSGRLIIAARE